MVLTICVGYARAVTNSSSVTDFYPYYLPLGVPLPGGARPTCNDCLQNTMAIFGSAATNGTQPVSQNYNEAADQINVACGPNFVNDNVMVTSAARRVRSDSIGSLGLLFVLGVMMLTWL
jgi:hypothetical protein